jgi:ATP-dependent Zn protease
MKRTSRGWITCLIIIGLVVAAMIPLLTSRQQHAQWSYSDLVRHAQAGEVKHFTISGGSAIATDKNGAKYDVSLPDQTATLASDLTAAGVNVHYQSSSGLGSTLISLLPNLLFFALIGALLWWLYRGLSRGPHNQAMSFGRSTTRLAAPEHSDVSLADVAGVERPRQS